MRQEQEMTGPFEIERKFLIHYPDIRKLESLPNCRKVRIVQTYLKPENGEKLRVRQWEENGNRLYFKTLKRDVTDVTRIEIEERLSEEEYLRLLKDADNLDRVRLGDLKTKFLRHQGAKAVEPFAWRLIELEKTL